MLKDSLFLFFTYYPSQLHVLLYNVLPKSLCLNLCALSLSLSLIANRVVGKSPSLLFLSLFFWGGISAICCTAGSSAAVVFFYALSSSSARLFFEDFCLLSAHYLLNTGDEDCITDCCKAFSSPYESTAF